MRWGTTIEIGRARGLALLLAAVLGLLAGAGAAHADVIAFDGISVPQLAHSLLRQPVQQRGQANPALSGADIASLRALIHKDDPGRIWIAVVTPISEKDVGQVANSLGNLINKDGIVLVVGGYNFYVSTTWGNSASTVLGAAVGNGSAPFAEQLRRAVVGFAKADSKAHHPTPLAASLAPPKSSKPKGTNAAAISPSTSATSPSATTGTATEPPGGRSTTSTGTSTSAAPASVSSAGHTKSGGGSSTALIVVGIAVAILILIGLGAFGRNARAAASVRKRRRDDFKTKANADLTKLGERLTDLDIDQQMPNADPGGKAEYVKALDCYQGGERRLKGNDPTELDKAAEVIEAGLKHIDQAEKLFDNHGRAKDLLPAQVVTRLTKLAQLHRSGALTDDEFAAEKKKLLS